MPKINGINMEYESGWPDGEDIVEGRNATALVRAELNRQMNLPRPQGGTTVPFPPPPSTSPGTPGGTGY